LKFVYGFTTKTIKQKEYIYFWQSTGTGHKTEQYMGRAGRLKTQRRVLTTKIAYLEGLEEEIRVSIEQAKAELEQLPSGEVTKT
jgi:hypothetical protein